MTSFRLALFSVLLSGIATACQTPTADCVNSPTSPIQIYIQGAPASASTCCNDAGSVKDGSADSGG